MNYRRLLRLRISLCCWRRHVPLANANLCTSAAMPWCHIALACHAMIMLFQFLPLYFQWTDLVLLKTRSSFVGFLLQLLEDWRVIAGRRSFLSVCFHILPHFLYINLSSLSGFSNADGGVFMPTAHTLL